MPHDAPHFLTALEGSGLAVAIRQSVWAYPTANVGHIVALTLFAFAAAPPADVVRPERPMALLGLLLMLLAVALLFTAEASHVGTNWVFQVKAALIVLGLGNAFFTGRIMQPLLDSAPAFARPRVCGFQHIFLWESGSALQRAGGSSPISELARSVTLCTPTGYEAA